MYSYRSPPFVCSQRSSIADRIDNQIERRLEVLVRMIEPLMLILIGTMVMFVIVGVLLPVFDLNSTIG
ncbi:MAG: type II secretion system F family protein [Planctomycetaceae bacterium]